MEEQNFLALGDLVRSSNKGFIQGVIAYLEIVSFFTNSRHAWWNNNDGTTTRYLLSRKEQESVGFVKKDLLYKKIQKKRTCFRIFLTTNSLTLHVTEEGSVKHYGLWRLAKAIRWLKSLIKFAHNILREFQLDFCQTFLFCNLNQTSKTCLGYCAFSTSSKAADCLFLASLLIPPSNFGRWYLANCV